MKATQALLTSVALLAACGERPQVLADVCMAHAQPLYQLAHVQLTLREERAQDRQAGGVAQHAEAFGDVFEEVRGYHLGHGKYSIAL